MGVTVTFVACYMESGKSFIITIVGAESSGKTTLAKQLARSLGCNWVPEYARTYLEQLDRSYTFDDLAEIAKGQIRLFLAEASPSPDPIIDTWEAIIHQIQQYKLNRAGDARLPADRVISMEDLLDRLKSLHKEIWIIDAGVLTIHLWADIKYGKTLPSVEEALSADPTSLYILCRPRKDWEFDPWRESPDLVDRVWIYNQYLNTLVARELPFIQVQV